MVYDDFTKFTKDQEHLITNEGFDYVEGSLILKNSPANSFFSSSDQHLINSLASENGILYCLEAVKYYHDEIIYTIEEVSKIYIYIIISKFYFFV